MPSDAAGLRLLAAAAACLGMTAPPAAHAGEPTIAVQICGRPGQSLPTDRKRPPDCPTACHATCPREQAAEDGGDCSAE